MTTKTVKPFAARYNRARDRRHYVTSWNSHIDELTSVLLESGTPVADWDATLKPLRDRVTEAADLIDWD